MGNNWKELSGDCLELRVMKNPLLMKHRRELNLSQVSLNLVTA